FRKLLPHIKSTAVDMAEAYAYPFGHERPWVRANMISSADGGAVGTTGRARELSSYVERTVMGSLRVFWEMVLVGAATACMEWYGGYDGAYSRPVVGRRPQGHGDTAWFVRRGTGRCSDRTYGVVSPLASASGLAEVAGRPTGCTADRRGLPEPGVAEESFDGRARGPQALGHHSARGTHRTSKTRGGARGTGGGGR